MTIFLILFFCLYLIWLIHPYFYVNYVIQNWVIENDFTLISKDVRFIRLGPFIYARNRAVYKITVETFEGATKKAWMMVGDVFLSDPTRYKVVWEEKPGTGLWYGQNIVFPFFSVLHFVGLLFLIATICTMVFDLNIESYFIEAAKKWD